MSEQAVSERYEFPESSNIAAMEWYPVEARLVTTFRGGGGLSHYSYAGVGEGIWQMLVAERGSIGQAFQNLIRKGPFPYTKLASYEPASEAVGVGRGTGQICPKCNQPTMIPAAAGSVCAVCGNMTRTREQAAFARKQDPRPRQPRRRQIRKLGR